MRQLTQAGQQTINDIAQRHGFSTDAVLSILDSVINGNATAAQFNHSEFGGSGQWMRGGMIMISDMFNNVLKSRIDALCNELSALVVSQPDLIRTGSFQSQNQGGQFQGNYGGSQQQGPSGPIGPVSLFVPPTAGSSGNWWPLDLGSPNSTGAQRNVRYAYFAQARRLAIDVGGQVTVYDTLDHQIGGFSQQQSFGGSLTFSSQHGLVDVASLPVVPIDGEPPPSSAPTSKPAQQAVSGGSPETGAADIFTMLEKLADLRNKGIVSDEEFARKKAELLSRL